MLDYYFSRVCALVFEVYTAESVSLFVSSTTFPTDLTENIRQHQACKLSLTHLMLHHRRTETKAVYIVEDVQSLTV